MEIILLLRRLSRTNSSNIDQPFIVSHSKRTEISIGIWAIPRHRNDKSSRRARHRGGGRHTQRDSIEALIKEVHGIKRGLIIGEGQPPQRRLAHRIISAAIYSRIS